MKELQKIKLSGAEVFPLVEGGKGINGTDGKSSGAWAKEGGVGTISMVSPTALDNSGKEIPELFHEKIRSFSFFCSCFCFMRAEQQFSCF